MTDLARRENPAARRLQVEVAPGKDAVVLTVHGEIDMASVGELDRALETAHRADVPAIIVDLTRLEFMDSTGVRSLLRAGERTMQSGRTLALRRVPPMALQVLEILGIDQRFTLLP